jgi:hypothetical protein
MVTGKEAMQYVRTLEPSAVRVLLKDRATSATLRTVCEWAVGPARAWSEVLVAAGMVPMPRPALLGVQGARNPGDRARRAAAMKALVALALVLLPSLAFAQAPDRYEFRLYSVGASAPTSSTQFPATEVVCNQAPPAATVGTVNPTRAIWDDPANAGRVCVWVPGGGVLVSLPIGSYEGSIVPIDAAGVGAESNKAPFSRQPVQAARTGLRFTRVAP